MNVQTVSGALFDKGHAATGPAPFNLAHLARQTMGDRKLALEVLGMFQTQTGDMRERMLSSDLQSRREIAHALVGSARGVGAEAIASCAAVIEKNPDDDNSVRQLSKLIDEASEFISQLR
ncbi:Hpt domain-containing protein [Nitratireductor kimnyeongensis]|uniref:Hpt domain-containing protein n=1 Tax=Nitratireductor kimnyeongensis TaxID=430679 RepID=A0ABW0T934_9HYPH|nr:Hpt domain-containing protein [Nitratireductor kimnyeongensis]QZZ35670.1 Hpt domain-containing protein [Nitratireductor kimnyeongensis]